VFCAVWFWCCGGLTPLIYSSWCWQMLAAKLIHLSVARGGALLIAGSRSFFRLVGVHVV
jgi:hypothetical protein